jgi:peroxiredoxin
VQSHLAEIESLGGQLLAVSFTQPEKLAAYLKRHPLPTPALADPQGEAYRVFELGRTSWRRLFRPRALVYYSRLIVRGWMPSKPVEGQDVLQLGGDFIVDRQRRLVYAYRSQESIDRPTPAQLIEALRRASH